MTATTFLGGKVTLHAGDCRDVLREFPDNHFDSVVTDPPYALVSIVKRFGKEGAAPAKHGADGLYSRLSKGFMQKSWDNGTVAFAPDFWAEVLRVLKPGGHVAAFGGDRTIHRLVCAIEDAGFEIRGTCAWIFGSGFPKSLNVSKQIDKAAGAVREVVGSKLDLPGYHLNGHDGGESFGAGLSSSTAETRLRASQITAPSTDAAKQWEGWGTSLKPAMELICLARKPLSESTVAANVLRWGTGAINVDACRVGVREKPKTTDPKHGGHTHNTYGAPSGGGNVLPAARWPANLIHDGSPEVLAAFPKTHSSGAARSGSNDPRQQNWSGNVGNAPANRSTGEMFRVGDSGSAARFFYQAKADQDSRMASRHPTVKPVALMQWLVRLITPPGGITCDPFAGTGTTGEAAWREGFSAILIEREAEYQADIARRMEYALTGPDTRSRAIAKAKSAGKAEDHGPLFAEDTA